eukprot:366555-Chlamydomonas_euryale.AAC.25
MVYCTCLGVRPHGQRIATNSPSHFTYIAQHAAQHDPKEEWKRQGYLRGTTVCYPAQPAIGQTLFSLCLSMWQHRATKLLCATTYCVCGSNGSLPPAPATKMHAPTHWSHLSATLLAATCTSLALPRAHSYPNCGALTPVQNQMWPSWAAASVCRWLAPCGGQSLGLPPAQTHLAFLCPGC